MHKDGEAVAAAIDGGAWRLPLPPLSATSLPEPYSPGDNPQVCGGSELCCREMVRFLTGLCASEEGPDVAF